MTKRMKSILITFILCYAFWLLLTLSVAPYELINGVIVCGITAWFASGFFVQDCEHTVKMLNPIDILVLLFYLVFVFGWELLKANWAMAMTVLFNKPVKQSMIRVPVRGITDGYGLALLSNCITLTPGTITIEVGSTDEEGVDCVMYIQWLTTTTTDREEAGEIIKGRMEKWIRRIWR